MIPLLTLIAIYAPAGHRATWFALMASLMNLALVAGELQTKYLNLDLSRRPGRLRAICSSRRWWPRLIGVAVPLAAILAFRQAGAVTAGAR